MILRIIFQLMVKTQAYMPIYYGLRRPMKRNDPLGAHAGPSGGHWASGGFRTGGASLEGAVGTMGCHKAHGLPEGL